MKSVKVDKMDVLSKLKENREKHAELVKKSKAGYLQEVKDELKMMLEEIETKEKVNLNILMRMHPPIDKTEEYDRAIEMLDMSVDETIEISNEEFRKFIQDKWSWSSEFRLSNTKYIK